MAREPIRCIIDTDVGPDDMIAIAFLLARDDVEIEAITIVNGLAHVERGAANVARVLALAGQSHVPVRIGRPAPLEGMAAFPAEWSSAPYNKAQLALGARFEAASATSRRSSIRATACCIRAACGP